MIQYHVGDVDRASERNGSLGSNFLKGSGHDHVQRHAEIHGDQIIRHSHGHHIQSPNPTAATAVLFTVRRSTLSGPYTAKGLGKCLGGAKLIAIVDYRP